MARYGGSCCNDSEGGIKCLYICIAVMGVIGVLGGIACCVCGGLSVSGDGVGSERLASGATTLGLGVLTLIVGGLAVPIAAFRMNASLPSKAMVLLAVLGIGASAASLVLVHKWKAAINGVEMTDDSTTTASADFDPVWEDKMTIAIEVLSHIVLQVHVQGLAQGVRISGLAKCCGRPYDIS